MIRQLSVTCCLYLLACSSDDASSAKTNAVGRDQDASTSRSHDAHDANDKGGAADAGRADTPQRDGGSAASDVKKGSSSTTKHDAGASHASSQRDDDAGTSTAPGSSSTMGGDDAGVPLSDSESCCIPHAKPGCNDSDVQRCVCDKLDTCCTQAWTVACTYIVTEKYCQAGVRDCVCGSGDGQWQQAACCNAEWTSTCDDVAQIKCGATVGCK